MRTRRAVPYAAAPLLDITDCAAVPFEPRVSLWPTTPRTSTASGVEVDLHIPQGTLTNPNAVRTADVRRAVFRLPMGMPLNPGMGDGLDSCTEEQIGFEPDERQVVDFGAGGGPLALGFEGRTTAALPDLATALEFRAALEALPNVEEGDLTVTGRPGGPWRVTFGRSLGGRDVATITGVHSEVQRLALRAQGGSFKLVFGGARTEPLPFDTDAATVRAALEGLPGIGPGTVTARAAGMAPALSFASSSGDTRARRRAPAGDHERAVRHRQLRQSGRARSGRLGGGRGDDPAGRRPPLRRRAAALPGSVEDRRRRTDVAAARQPAQGQPLPRRPGGQSLRLALRRLPRRQRRRRPDQDCRPLRRRAGLRAGDRVDRERSSAAARRSRAPVQERQSGNHDHAGKVRRRCDRLGADPLVRRAPSNRNFEVHDRPELPGGPGGPPLQRWLEQAPWPVPTRHSAPQITRSSRSPRF